MDSFDIAKIFSYPHVLNSEEIQLERDLGDYRERGGKETYFSCMCFFF